MLKIGEWFQKGWAWAKYKLKELNPFQSDEQDDKEYAEDLKEIANNSAKNRAWVNTKIGGTTQMLVGAIGSGAKSAGNSVDSFFKTESTTAATSDMMGIEKLNNISKRI